MDSGLEVPLTLVSAPAGYGKSVLVSHWAESSKYPCAWLSLDEGDGEVVEFLGYLVAAVRTAIPEACPETEALRRAPHPPPLKVMARCLANELDALAAPLVLALDDYHRLPASSKNHELLALLLEYPPRPLRLVLITRRDPPLPLASLRGKGHLAEVRLQDLRFTTAETSKYLETTAGLQVSPEALANLQIQTEGWAVGLQLVSLYLRDVEDPDKYLKELSGGIEQTQEYLLEEVLARHSRQMQDWMLQTSILDRFCPGLCESVCASGEPASDLDGREFVDTLRRDNLFIISLDARGEWYRYHHLFESLLEERLCRRQGPEEVAKLHLRASEWLEGEGLIGEALRHALAAEDPERASQVVERHARPVMNEDQWYVLEKWLSNLPVAVVQARPELLLAQAWTHYYRLEVALIPPVLDRIDELMGDGTEMHELSGEVALFRGFCSLLSGESARSLKYLEHALERIPGSDVEFRAETELLFGLAGQMEGQKDRVTHALANWLEASLPRHALRESRLLLTLVFVHYLAGDPTRAAQYLRRYRGVAERGGMSNALAWNDYLEGLIHLQRGELEAAIGLLEEAGKRKYFHYTRAAVDAVVALTLAFQANGEPEKAAAALESLVEFTDYLGPPFPNLADSCAARLALLQGRSMLAVRWLETSAPPMPEVMLWWLEIPCITHCRALVAEGSVASLREAEAQLQEYAEGNEAQHNTYQLIGILALQAIAFDKQGKGDEGRAVLERALTLAQPGGILFPFLEFGPPMADLLRQQLRQEPDNNFIRQVLGAFASDKPTPALTPASSDLVEPLTPREEEILELLAKRLRDKEIAQRLGISSATVKYHTKNLYQKLGVHGRRDAVKKARELHLISPP